MLDPAPHLKAAFATDSRNWVDADLAWSRHLMVYDVTLGGSDLLHARDYRTGDAADQLAAKLRVLGGCGVLFSTGLSDQTALTLSQAGIFPVVLEQRRPISTVLSRLQTLMRRDPPLWMCRVLRYGAPIHDPR